MSDQTEQSSLSFEQAVAELEQIINALEQGELPLEDSLKQFERAVSLSRLSQQKLQAAEQKVEMLLQQRNGETLEPFATQNGTDD
ncbi:exodeoxyribonuclease VII small subunit [Aliidiomarina celeris]|uniref:exodeoxyribonuclease VII small subunit n=1 Tax=Aliidiomarina celeris TaxID=2249428 RepID=UPI000DE9B916|nr:exodeoxyribonuclease VII small subunit [Aliidiomarina celeris]